MAQAPEDAPASDTPSQPSVASTGNGSQTSQGAQPSSKKRGSFLDSLSKFGDKAKQAAVAAGKSVEKFATEVKEDMDKAKSMEGLLTMAIEEINKYVKRRETLTGNVEQLNKVLDPFTDVAGLCFIVPGSLTLGNIGGSYGRGIVIKRFSNGNWSLPLAIQLIEGKLGFSVGLQISKLFFALKNEQAVDNFSQKGNVKLGAGAAAAFGNKGFDAQGDVKASKNSLTKTTNDAKEVATTNAAVGSTSGAAIGVTVGFGTYQSFNKINEQTYQSFNIEKLLNTQLNVAANEISKKRNENNPPQAAYTSSVDDVKQNDENKVLIDGVVDLTQTLAALIDNEIDLAQEMARARKQAKKLAEQQAKAAQEAQAAQAAQQQQQQQGQGQSQPSADV